MRRPSGSAATPDLQRPGHTSHLKSLRARTEVSGCQTLGILDLSATIAEIGRVTEFVTRLNPDSSRGDKLENLAACSGG